MLLGAPLDLTGSFRQGTSEAPGRIRLVSHVLETYSPNLGRDLEQIGLADWGDIAVDGLPMESALEQIEAAAVEATSNGFTLVLGGEHTLALAVARAIATVHPFLAVLQVDAHADLRDEYESLRVSHATVFRRLADELEWRALIQFGVRSCTSEERALSGRCLYSSPTLSLPRSVRDRLGRRPVYLSVDIDVLDPSCAPGTGCPEPGGCSFQELLSLIYSLKSLNVVAADISEVLPRADCSDITCAAAAKLAREMVLLFAGSSREAMPGPRASFSR